MFGFRLAVALDRRREKSHADKEKTAVPGREERVRMGVTQASSVWTCCSLLPIKYSHDPRWKGVGFAVLAAND